tara:strand:+ start:334 stop:1422 length:1089 start_codon:yes stop_codon:yes gene_type:complete
MNRILKRPMFRIGGSAGTGITSGLDTPKRGLVDGPGKYSQDDPQDRTFKPSIEQALETAKLANDPRVRNVLFPRAGGISPGTLPGFLTSFGLNLASATPTGTGFGGLAATAAKAAQTPFQTFQAAKLAEADDKGKFARDLFEGDIQSQYDLEEQRLKNLKSNEVEYAKKQAADAISQIYQTDINEIQSKIDNLDPSADIEQIEEFNKQIAELKKQSKADQKSIYLGSATDQEYQRQLILKLVGAGEVLEDILKYFPNAVDIMGPGFEFPKREEGKTGGRIGYRDGTKMMESIVEQEKEQGEVQDLSYTQLRSRLPNEISNEIVMLLANSKQALLDFANIQTTQDIQSFNQQYDVNLTLPQGA